MRFVGAVLAVWCGGSFRLMVWCSVAVFVVFRFDWIYSYCIRLLCGHHINAGIFTVSRL
jgi:hypothetical protein